MSRFFPTSNRPIGDNKVKKGKGYQSVKEPGFKGSSKGKGGGKAKLDPNEGVKPLSKQKGAEY